MTNKKREMTMKKNLSLPKQILLALVLGVIVGFICDQAGIPQLTTNYLKPFGTIFVNLLKFIVVPVVLLSMIEGILSMGDMKKVGSIGWKTVAFFLCTTAVACVIGLVLGNLFETNLRRSLVLSGGSASIFFTRPVCLLILVLSVVFAFLPEIKGIVAKIKASRAGAGAR